MPVSRADTPPLLKVPTHGPSHAEEAALISQLETEVQAAYRKALPRAEFQWIDCTGLVDLLGAVHCLTATVPEIPDSGS